MENPWLSDIAASQPHHSLLLVMIAGHSNSAIIASILFYGRKLNGFMEGTAFKQKPDMDI